MDAPARRGGGPEHLYILGDNQCCQNIADPVHHVGPQSLGLVVLNEAFEAPMAHGS